jgi:hypothetical protein
MLLSSYQLLFGGTMRELVHERIIDLVDSDGRPYDRAFVYAEPQADGTWRGRIEFAPSAGKKVVRTGYETTQSHVEGVAYWATGLEPLYFEGALERARRRGGGAPDEVEPGPAAALPAALISEAIHFEVDTLDPEVPLRIMGTRTLVPGLRRRVHNGGIVVYEGTQRSAGADRPGTYGFAVQFASANAAALVANTLWSELHGAGATLRVEDVEVPITNAAIKEALLGALVE